MPTDVAGGSTADRAAPQQGPFAATGLTAAGSIVAKHTAATPHQSFMTIVGQLVAVTVAVELAGYSTTAGRVVAAVLVGLWLAFLVNNSDALFGALTVKRT